MRAIVISGVSGAGKSSVVKTLEDVGFYCVDNLPVSLLRSFFDLSSQSVEGIRKIALVIDARDSQNIGQLPAVLEELSREGNSFEIVFLEASDESLSRRFNETRRRHPLSPEGSPLEGIKKERSLLGPVRELADYIIDTSNLSPTDLRQKFLKTYGGFRKGAELAIKVSSFGFKYGLPINADLVLDVRFLANPYFREDLKGKTGKEGAVVDFVMAQKDAKQFLKEAKRFLEFLIPRFAREGKSYLHLAIGCTGGRHRSVVMSREVVSLLSTLGYKVKEDHRDMERA